MKENNLIHVKVEHEEAVELKKNLLSLELNLLNTIRNIKKYKSIRMNELKLKNKLKRATSSVIINTKKIQENLPKIKINKVPKRKTENYSEEIKEKSSRDFVIEKELREIQEKLMALQG